MPDSNWDMIKGSLNWDAMSEMAREMRVTFVGNPPSQENRWMREYGSAPPQRHANPDHIEHVVDGSTVMPYTHEVVQGHMITGSWMAYAHCAACLIGMRYVLTDEREDEWLRIATQQQYNGVTPHTMRELARLSGQPTTFQQQQQQQSYMEREFQRERIQKMRRDPTRPDVRYVRGPDGRDVPVPIDLYEFKMPESSMERDEMWRRAAEQKAAYLDEMIGFEIRNPRDMFKGLMP